MPDTPPVGTVPASGRWDGWEDALVERFVPGGPPARALVVVSRLADGSRLWFGIAAALAVVPRWRTAAAEAATAALLAAGATQVVQHVVRRPRPPADHPVRRFLATPGSSSFPSSHTAVATAFVAAAARRNPGLAAALAPLAATLAYGRVRLRVHRPTDVLAGAVLGVAVAPVPRHLAERVSTSQGL